MGVYLEIILKDLHIVLNKPERVEGWLRIAEELITEKFG